MRKRILLISSTWNNFYLYALLEGMLRCVKEKDAELYVFNAYDEALESEFHRMEREIYKLPDVNQFDGVLLAVNSVGNQYAVDELSQYYLTMGKKILSLELKLDHIPTIGTDNYQAEYELVEHLIVEHGCRKLNYLGGPAEHKENRERFQAFCDCLNAHGLEVESQRVLNYTFRETDGTLAYQEFKSRGLHLPDALVCANDHMALGYCIAAAEDGFLAPRDFRITGFDNVQYGQEYYPSITSVDRCWEQLGYDSITQLLDMLDGKEFRTSLFSGQRVVLNESCGCQMQERDFHGLLANIHKEKLLSEQMLTFERTSRKLLCSSVDMEDFEKRIRSCQKMAGLEHLAICLSASLFTSPKDSKLSYDEEFDVYACKDAKKLARNGSLVPDAWKKDHQVFFFSPLHFGAINFGYCVTTYSGCSQLRVDHRNLMESICLGLEGIRQHEALRQMNRKLEDLYRRDAMTGMYNRFGYEQIAEKFYEQQKGKIYAAYMDLDNLKLINDRYGHAMGDKSIYGVSSGIRHVFERDSIQVRMGGDEFLVLGVYQCEEEVLEKENSLRIYLEKYCEVHQLPFPLRISAGYFCNGTGSCSLDQMIQIADQNMYRVKQGKK